MNAELKELADAYIEENDFYADDAEYTLTCFDENEAEYFIFVDVGEKTIALTISVGEDEEYPIDEGLELLDKELPDGMAYGLVAFDDDSTISFSMQDFGPDMELPEWVDRPE